MALAYAEMVVAEEVPACRLVIKACQRYLRMLGLAETEQEGFYFSFESAIEACAFVESLAHIKGDKAREPFIMEPWQIFKTCAVFGFRWAESGTRVVNTVYLEEPRKHGKAEWIENLIPTTTGLKRMADIEVGDMVFAIDGTPTKVLATSPIWASRPCLEVEFSSGEKIIVDENHEWMTEPRRLGVRAEPKTAKRKTPGALGRSRIYETREIRDSLRHGSRGNNNHFVPLAGAHQLAEKLFTVSPYVLGAWLGSGTSLNAEITIAEEEVVREIAKSGESIRPRLRESSPYLHIVGSGGKSQAARNVSLQARLRKLGLLGNKHIPDAYFLGSEEQRRALLQGLMDTDGTSSVATNGLARCEFITTTPAVRDGIIRLLGSLGLKPTVTEARATLYGKDCGPKWRVYFNAYREDAPFRMERKLARLSPRPPKRTRASTRAIAAINDAGMRPTKCITIEHPSHLYQTGVTGIPTHNSLWAAAIGLYLTTVEAGIGDDLYIIAPKFDQGLKVLEPYQKLALNIPALVEQYGIKSTAKTSHVRATDSNVIVLAALGEKQDGHDPKTVIADEFHAVPPDIYKVMKSAGRARDEKMFLIIGSAGRHTFGTGWDEHRSAEDLLNGKIGDRFHYFALIYTVDPEDVAEWWTERVIRKANPGLGVSVSLRNILQEAQDARTKPLDKVEFLRTALNLWGHSEAILFPKEKWDRCARPNMTLDMMAGKRGWLGLDLASRNDMVALVALFEEQLGTLSNTDAGLVPDVDLFAFAWHFVPEKGVWIEDEDLIAPYQSWKESGHLQFTAGSRHRYGELRTKVFDLLDRFNIEMVVIDDQQANEFFNALLDADKPVQAFRKNAGNFSDPTKDLISRINGEELGLFHTGNPVLGWNMQNVIGGPDTADRILGKKPAPNSNQKIDGFDALVMANAARLQMIQVDEPRKTSASVRNGMRRL